MAVNRYFRRGITKVWWVPTITLSAPTAAQVLAGVELTTPGDLADLTGLSYSNQPIAGPDWNDNFDGKEPGIDQAVDCVLTFYDKKGTAPANPLRTTLVKGAQGNLVVFPGGIAGAAPAAADICDVWPVSSSGPAKLYSATELAKWHVTLPAKTRPNQDVALV